MSKYSLKNIFLGVGIGIVITSLININSGLRPLAIEELEREAEKHGLRLVKIADIEKNKPQEAAPTPTPTAVPTPKDKDDTKNEVFIEINIKQGDTSHFVAETLQQKGLINNKNDFINRLDELNKANKLQVGSFKIKKGLDLDSIIDILTTIP
ncbi:MAG: hypothetical protein ACOZCL_04890 [Bacillota bacterium]